MQKVVDFLERNVQWLVLGLGGIVFLLMVYWYVITPPVTVTIGSQNLKPGEIDELTARQLVPKAKQAISSTEVPEPLKHTEDVVHYAKDFQAKAFLGPENAIVMRNVNFPGQPIPTPQGPGPGPTPTGPTAGKVDVLPPIIAAAWDAGNNGRSVVLMPDPAKKRKRDEAANNAPVQTVDMIQKDKDWVTEAFTIDVDKLGKEWKKVFGKFEDLPPNVYETQIVYVQLIREEKQPNGEWGNRTTVPPLAMHEVPPFPDQNDKQKVLEFREWVTQHPDLVTQPPFYQVAENGGDQWAPPGDETAAVQTAAPATPAATPKAPRYPGGYGPYGRPGGYPGYPGGYGGRPGGYGPAGYGGRPGGYGPAGYGGPRGGQRGRGAGYSGSDPGRPPAGYGYPPGAYGRPGGYPYPGMYPGGPGMYPGGPGMYGRPGGYPGYPPGATGGTSAGPGSFNVLNVTEPLKVWAHDDTVEAGKTYRYAIVYYLRNPLFETFNIAANEKLSDQFAIKSPMSNWSSGVKVTAKVNFFLAGVTKDAVKFEVFTWAKGNWKSKVIQRAPGDLIPDTTWTVVDQRKEGNDPYVLLVNQGGQIQRRDYQTDRKSPLYQQLKSQIETKKESTASVDR